MNDKELKEVRDIKKLLILQLLNSGVQGDAIAKLLEIDAGNFSRDYPVRKLLKKRERDGKTTRSKDSRSSQV